jgi:hypothetical protein
MTITSLLLEWQVLQHAQQTSEQLESEKEKRPKSPLKCACFMSCANGRCSSFRSTTVSPQPAEQPILLHRVRRADHSCMSSKINRAYIVC